MFDEKKIFYNFFFTISEQSRITTFATTLRVTNKLKEFFTEKYYTEIFLYARLYISETSGKCRECALEKVGEVK